ncbi:MAG: FGGY family carbohydrate kinase [Thermoanaerobaculia bacterium]
MTSDANVIAVVDQGSTTTKGALYTPAGECVFQAAIAVERRVEGVAVEHDAGELARGVDELVRELVRREERVAALGLTCQRSTCLVWDRATGEPLTPALSWQDRSELDRIEKLAGHGAEVTRRTGLPLSPHYAAPKLARLLDEIPRGRQRAAEGELVAGTLDAFLVRRLVGVDATEPGHAGRSLLYNLDSGDWDPRLCELFGIPPAALPELRPSAGHWGEVAGVPLLAVAGDQQAALLGHGGWITGTAVAHFGTGAFVLTSTGSEPARHPGLLSAVLAATQTGRRFQIEGAVNSAGSAVDRACQLTGERLEDWQETRLDVDSLPLVLPALAGVGAPWWRPEARGLLTGGELEIIGPELLGGVLAGVAMRVVDCLEALREAGARLRVLRSSGKLTRLRGLVDLIADAGQIEVEVSSQEETGLLGMAKLVVSVLDSDEAPLAASPAAAYRRSPNWDPARAAAIRTRWQRFVRSVLDLE